jgi:hypothetical protein
MSDINWEWTNNWCDECPAMDVHRVAEKIAILVTERGGRLSLSVERLRNQIMEYITWRRRFAAYQISPPRHELRPPKDWTEHAERVWTDWVTDTFSVEDWVEQVIRPIFGTDERNWEAHMGTRWRTEILVFLPWWIQRTWEIVDTYDPTPVTDNSDTNSDDGC